MSQSKRTSQRERRAIGEVELPIEKLMAAREWSSCCVGVEALLEVEADRIRRPPPQPRKARRKD